MPPLLLELWREQHPLGHEQPALDFMANFPAAKSAPLIQRDCSRGSPPDVLILNAGARLPMKPIDQQSWDEFSTAR
jgi:hypothetical protein